MPKLWIRVALLAGLSALAVHVALAAGHGSKAHWGYEGAEGPDNWSKAFPRCGGNSQAPIDIKGPFAAASAPIGVRYKPSKLRIIDNGHTIQVNYDAGSSMRVGKERFDLLQFHFHRPSEEKLDGEAKAMVVHFVHKSAAGKLAVIGVLLEEGKDSETISTLWSNLPKHAGKETVVSRVTIDASRLLPASLDYYHYMGSLTTPPCTEGVAFYILKHPVQVSKAQVAAFPYEMNARPVQPLNGRQVAESGK